MFNGFKSMDIEVEGARIFTRHAGSGPPLLLLHGYPQTHAIWHEVAPSLVNDFTVVVADLRGYGDSSKPDAQLDPNSYSKRRMALDCVQAMEHLGHDSFYVAGHDRGARVTYRMALDHPDRILKAALLDIVPTRAIFDSLSKELATAYFHWYFLVQPNSLPERLIESNPEHFLRCLLGGWSNQESKFSPEAFAEYVRCFSDPATIRATCDDFRATMSVDLQHDDEDDRTGTKVECPLLLMWGESGPMARNFNMLSAWRERAHDIRGVGLKCGHFLPDEAPGEVSFELRKFFSVS